MNPQVNTGLIPRLRLVYLEVRIAAKMLAQGLDFNTHYQFGLLMFVAHDFPPYSSACVMFLFSAVRLFWFFF